MEKPKFLKRPSAVAVPKLDASAGKPQTINSKGRNPLLTEEGEEFLNYRVQQEEYSARIYLSMAMWLENEGYLGAGKLWKKYSDEEMLHANDARTYLLSMGVQPITPMLEAPEQSYKGLPEIIKKSYDHEIEVSSQIKELSSYAMSIGDHMLYTLGQTYLKEQVEEHNKMQNWMDRLSAFGEDKLALRFLDEEMGG
jgi:ferritin